MKTLWRSLCVASGLCVALSATLAAAEESVVLGEDDTLTSGIPGTGRLTNEQIEEWLANPANHEPLKVTLPLGMNLGESQIKGLDKNPLTRAKIERKAIGKEKMDGHPCVKQQVVITDDAGHKSEATVWTATDLRDFPVCVATKESEGTVVMRFRQIQFTRAETNRFEPPAGYIECADMQVLMAGPVTKFMKENGTSVKAITKTKSPSPKSAVTTTKKK